MAPTLHHSPYASCPPPDTAPSEPSCHQPAQWHSAPSAATPAPGSHSPGWHFTLLPDWAPALPSLQRPVIPTVCRSACSVVFPKQAWSGLSPSPRGLPGPPCPHLAVQVGPLFSGLPPTAAWDPLCHSVSLCGRVCFSLSPLLSLSCLRAGSCDPEGLGVLPGNRSLAGSRAPPNLSWMKK